MVDMAVVIIFLTFFSAVTGDPDNQVDKSCELHVTNESRAMFTETILRKRFNFMYLKLNFADMNGTVQSLTDVIGPTHWIWTYKGKDGGHQYLYLPQDFGYLSFGLLWSKSNSSEYPINVYHNGNCSGLTMGQNTSDLLVGEALGRMASGIAARHDLYNSSYWCYTKKMPLNRGSLYSACEHAICTLQTTEYSCCKYVISFVSRNRRIECSKEHYHFNELWWALPIIAGEICFALYPLLLSTIGGNIQKLTKKSKRQTDDGSDSEDLPQIKYIRLRQEYPVTLVSTVFAPILKLCRPIFQATLCARLWRTLLIILPMTLPAIGLYLDATYSPSLIKEELAKGVVFDFSSMIAGFARSGRFLHILGGPYVAIIMHVTFGTMLLTFPENLEALLIKGLFNPKRNPYFVLTIPLKYRQKLGGISLKNRSGYIRFHNYLLLQLLMIVNWRFWRHVLRIFKHRWTAGLKPVLRRWNRQPSLFVVAMYIIFPFYFVFCIIEMAFCLLYYGVPVVSCFFILLNAYITALRAHFGDRSLLLNIFSRLFILGTAIAFCITWYLNCVIFFDGFWLLTRITMFTYTGIIQFPRLSYGYIILVFMAFYYLMDSLNNFGANYQELLKISIDVCEKVQSKVSCEFARGLVRKNSIHLQLFNIIVEKHMPKRVQVCSTVIKVASVISILWISIELLITFDKFQDLSLISHVFTVLFICALPKICRDLCITRRRNKTNKLRKRIYRTVTDYCNKNGNMDSSSDLESFGVYSGTGYEYLDIESD